MDNPFKKVIVKASTNVINNQMAMLAFHRRLAEVMELSPEDIQGVKNNNIHYYVDKYIIGARSFCYMEAFNKWVTLLYGVPISMGTLKVGYSNIQLGTYDSDRWLYRPRGTSTIILPSKTEQDIILDCVRNFSEKSS